ncbi:MAG: RsmB/NOP family class I SAM-dependent RNA methyltransferase, partial [Lachnospiraceae bacterium]|nr:RsmB/NOP family class I SAM-dependent RNA methyltransferase [Lachnospiraceae bacterium]
MKNELGPAWDAFAAAYEEKAWRGYRWNRTKLQKCLGADGTGLYVGETFRFDSTVDEPVAWCRNGRYLTDESMSKDPLHFAGAYYIQEPSAMLPAALLAAQPGDRVLDLCAAPGGKSTQLLDDMVDTGLLVSNDISASRAKAIVKNVERFGYGQILVTAESPDKLAAVFPEYFDKILVDAPCSGEGMFRREPSMREEWLRKGPDFYQPLQREILSQAAQMLRPGGRLVYSTCTFCL